MVKRKPRRPKAPDREDLRAITRILWEHEADDLANSDLLYDFCSERNIPLDAMVAEFLAYVQPVTSSAKH